MAEIVYPTSVKFDGPFLLDFEQLAQLDLVFEEEWETLNRYRKQRIREEADTKIAELEAEGMEWDRDEIEARVGEYSRLSPESREIVVEFKSGKQAKGETFAEIARAPDVQRESPVGFHATMVSADALVSLSSGSRALDSDHYLQLSVKPFGEVTRGAQFKIERWVKQASAPTWQRIWCKVISLVPIHWLLFFCSLCVLLFSLSTSYEDRALARSHNAYMRKLREEAHALLNKGIAASDLPKAVELNLKLTSRHMPLDLDISPIPPLKWPYFLSAITFVFSLLVAFRPRRIQMAIGLGERSVVRWRRWLKFLSVTFPGLIITGVILPIIVDRFFL